MLERGKIERAAVGLNDMSNRRAKAAPRDGNSRPFFEIAAEVSGHLPRDASVRSELKPPQREGKTFKPWENSQMGFGDLIDIINPLQHIPVIATIYRNRTGDGIGAAPRVIGGALWGRVGGFVSGLVNVLVDSFTGKDIGDHIYSALFGASGNSRAVRPKTMAAALPLQLPKSQVILAQSRFDTSNTESPFGDFDDDGGFYVTGRSAKLAESLASRSIASAASDAVAALSSYEENVDLDESKESFRFRFPA